MLTVAGPGIPFGQTTTTTTPLGWTISQYRARAIDLAQGRGAMVLVSLGKDGADPIAQSFTDRSAFFDRYSEWSERPGSRVYIATIEDGEVGDEAFFVATAESLVTVTKTQWQKAWPYALGAGAAVALGLVARSYLAKRAVRAVVPVAGWRRLQYRRKRNKCRRRF